MKNRRLSARAVVSLMLSAMLFCMPMGAFFANRTNTIEVHAEDSAEQKTESAAEEGSEKVQRPVMIIRTVPVVEKIIQSSPRRIQQKIPQKAQLRRYSLPQNAPAKKSAASMRWMKIVRCVQRTIRNVPISIRA